VTPSFAPIRGYNNVVWESGGIGSTVTPWHFACGTCTAAGAPGPGDDMAWSYSQYVALTPTCTGATCNYDPFALGTNNQTENPLFLVNVPHISFGSPCRNTGLLPANPPLVDFDGEPRVMGGPNAIDRGADEFLESCFIRGDANFDSSVNIADAVAILLSLFVPGTPPLQCADSGDVNDDGSSNIADAVYLLNALFTVGGSPPPAPYPGLGGDPTSDTLQCVGPPGAPVGC
jgi:hypothetical protein